MKTRRVVLVICSVLVVAALAGTVVFAFFWKSNSLHGDVDQTASLPQLPRVDGTVNGFYEQKVNWVPCLPGDVSEPTLEGKPEDMQSYECAHISAPLDWDSPSSETISLKIAVHRSPQSKGALFFNPGGPGGSATTYLSRIVESFFSKDLTNAYDIVAMDPRGVGASTPVICTTNAEKDENSAEAGNIEIQGSEGKKTPEQIVEDNHQEAKKFADGCTRLSGKIVQHVDTVSAAKDFDVARAVLQQKQFNYLGYSYGTFLGSTYANLFADKVGRMVLDGAVDPALSGDDVSKLQLYGFEESIRHWIIDCQAGAKCPLAGDVKNGVRTIVDFLHELETSPLPTSDKAPPLTRSLAESAIIAVMYQTDSYGALVTAMEQALKHNDGTMLLHINDTVQGRNSDGTYKDNSSDAIRAINALDYPPTGTIKDWEANAQQMKKDLPILGSSGGYPSAWLEGWPFKAKNKRLPIGAAGSPPIMVIGTVHDPATPYQMSQNLSQELEKGFLVTYDGWGHTAYRKSGSQCILKAVDSFLIDGSTPQRGLVCQ